MGGININNYTCGWDEEPCGMWILNDGLVIGE